MRRAGAGGEGSPWPMARTGGCNALGRELHVNTVGHCRVDPSETQRIFPSVTEGKEVALCFFCTWLRLRSHVQFGPC